MNEKEYKAWHVRIPPNGEKIDRFFGIIIKNTSSRDQARLMVLTPNEAFTKTSQKEQDLVRNETANKGVLNEQE